MSTEDASFYYFDTECDKWLPATAQELVDKNDLTLLVKIVQEDGTLTPPMTFRDLLAAVYHKPETHPIRGTLCIVLGIVPIVISILAETWFFIIAGLGLVGYGIKCFFGEQDD